MIYDYYVSIFFITITIIFSTLIVYINSLLVEEVHDTEKNSAYECGFQPIDLNLQQFEVKYYVIGILFLIFDVEIIFLMPFINISYCLNSAIVFCFLFFVFCFFLTFLYEWKNNFIDWE